MSGWSVSFAPLFPWQAIAGLAMLAGAFALYGITRRVRGSWLRLTAWAMLALALANPSLLQEERDPLKTVVAMVVDRLTHEECHHAEGEPRVGEPAREVRESTDGCCIRG